MFVIYDLSGKITGSISGPGKDYGDILTRQGVQWLFYEGATTLDIHTSYVDVESKAVRPCKPIELVVDKVEFVADEVDAVKITGIPLGSDIFISCNNEPYSQFIANDDELEFSSEDAAEYRVFVSCQKHIPATITLVAKSPPVVSLNVPDYSKVLA